MNIKKLLGQFSNVVSPSGYEYMAEPKIKQIIAENFDGVFEEVSFDKFGGCHLIKKTASQTVNPKKIMFEAHIDQIGFVVTEILEGGFLRIKPLGGIDKNILPATEFYVYTYAEDEPFIFSADKKILAIAASVPPHLKKTDGNALPGFEAIYLDSGYDSKEELEKIVKVGSPATFKPNFLHLENDLFSCCALDDRVCAAIMMIAAKSLEMAGTEIHMALCAGEETSGVGAATAAFNIQPDFAVVLDVDFARDPGVEAAVSIEVGKGPGLTYSAATNISLTKKIINLAKDKKIPVQANANPASTSTNADIIQITGEGIPCALVSAPLKNMHTASEICSVKDIESAAELIREIMENAEELI
ncbi:MAG: M20/M25/M40 family metallo-hydrolase [Oscillospiraceae bacterium]|nr:M20/M25/M40 family metallo-hydrolase [Oscillospiraceae bacterium]